MAVSAPLHHGTVKIGNAEVGSGNPCFVIAEAGVNHNGDIELAHKLVDAAKETGADAVKFQMFRSAELVTGGAEKANYQVETTGTGGAQIDMLRALELTDEGHAELKRHCDEVGITYLCTPYEEASTDVLDRLGVAAFKIASTDTVNVPFLRYVAAKSRPVIISTGLSTLADAELAVDALGALGGNGRTVVLHCTSEYPAPLAEANLRVINTLDRALGCPIGFSDHTEGIGAAPYAVAVGACCIEKHFTLDREMVGPDHRASLNTEEFTELVRTIRDVEAALGDGIKRVVASEAANKPRMRKSVVARVDIAAGQAISAEMLTAKRPGSGLEPVWTDRIVGRRAARDIGRDELVTLDSVDWSN